MIVHTHTFHKMVFALLTTTWAQIRLERFLRFFAKIAPTEFVSSMFVLGKMFVYFTTLDASIISHVSQSIYTSW